MTKHSTERSVHSDTHRHGAIERKDASMSDEPLSVGIREKPGDGWKSLKFFWVDVPAALVVTPVALCFGLGIAVDSMAPFITAGLISSIVAGFVVTFIRGSYMTIYGPAAGLAPVLAWGAVMLGGGNTEKGYQLVYPLIILCGLTQVLLSRIKAANFSSMFPTAVVEGMMGGVGLLIITKQVPKLLGVKVESHGFFGVWKETFQSLPQLNAKVLVLGIACVLALFILDIAKKKIKWRFVRYVPPHFVVVVGGTFAGWWLGLEPQHLITIPADVFHMGFTLPDLSDFATSWLEFVVLGLKSLLFLVIISMVAVTESLATTRSVDKGDKRYHRRSDLNRVLKANGLANSFSALLGGLAVVPGGVKSKVNQEAGGKTTNVNVFVAILLLCCLMWGKSLMAMIPLTVLAGMLVSIGIKLLWKLSALWNVGKEQIALFAITAAMSVITDLALGVMSGVLLKVYFHVSHHCWGSGGNFQDLFRHPVEKQGLIDGVWHVSFNRPVVCFNAPHLNSVLEQAPADARQVRFHFGEGVTIIDHTCNEALHEFTEEREYEGVLVTMTGTERLQPKTEHPLCMRLAPVETAV